MYQVLFLSAKATTNETDEILGLMKVKAFLWRETQSNQNNIILLDSDKR